ncbi:hypothetical protein ACOALA_20305 [Alicyclobacillus acidoterrestris]|uniref:hypothetical protein n=1 Tax=Alicyclobacillus acidoterrestris TaxID=1450 RepID=UPI003F5375A1
MHGIKARMNRTQKALSKLEKQAYEMLSRRIAVLGYEPDEVFAVLPMGNQATHARLMVFLEYEELNKDYPLLAITELQYACAWYPAVMIRYLYYLLADVGVPPIEELDVYRELILEQHPEKLVELTDLERRWKACLTS